MQKSLSTRYVTTTRPNMRCPSCVRQSDAEAQCWVIIMPFHDRSQHAQVSRKKIMQQNVCYVTSLTAIVRTYTIPAHTRHDIDDLLLVITRWSGPSCFESHMNAFNGHQNQQREICEPCQLKHASLHVGADSGSHISTIVCTFCGWRTSLHSMRLLDR